MGRQVNSSATAAGVAAVPPDAYVQRLFKLIPAEISGAYVAISSMIGPTNDHDDFLLAISAAVLFVVVPLYMYQVQSVRNISQIVVSTISFPIWAANVSNIQLIEDAHRLYGVDIPSVALGILLILWTTITPLFVK